MSERVDILFVGGGLANSLAAFRLRQWKPHLRILLLEQQPSVGGDHTWSFHDSDLTPEQRSWMAPFVSKHWPAYDVRFPELNRTLSTGYNSIRSSQFHRLIEKEISPSLRLNQQVETIEPQRVVLKNGDEIQASCVIDGRGWEAGEKHRGGFQKFFGLDVVLKNPHGLTHPVLMDATVLQTDGYRFFYLLPWTETSLLVEETHFSDNPILPKEILRTEVMNYIQRKGWTLASIAREEEGVLPIPLQGPGPLFPENVTLSGMRAGLFHAATGYSLPSAVQFADDFSALPSYSSTAVSAWAQMRAQKHWRRQWFFRFLNRMLFKAAKPEKRFGVLQMFYRRSPGLIGRFYAGRLTSMDVVQILSGKPPVSPWSAARCLFER